VIPDALLVNKNMLQLDMRSTGSRLKLADAAGAGGRDDRLDMTLIDADCAKWEDGWKLPEAVRRRTARSRSCCTGPSRKTAPSNSINVVDRQDYMDRLFRLKWKQLGGRLDGKTIGHAAARSRLLAEHVSRALPEVVRDTNKPSDNALARTVFLSLGALEADPVLGSRPCRPVAGQTDLYARRRGGAQLDARARHRRHRPGDGKRFRPVAPRAHQPAADGRPAARRPAQQLGAGIHGQHADRGGRRHHAPRLNGSPAAGARA
jgi:hypothetical protein